MLAARLVLVTGAIMQLLLISALPFDALTTIDRYSFLVLAANVVISLALAAMLARYPRASIGVLTIVTILSVWQLLRFAHVAIGLVPNQLAQVSWEQAAPYIVASFEYVSFPLAFLVAWPIRKVT